MQLLIFIINVTVVNKKKVGTLHKNNAPNVSFEKLMVLQKSYLKDIVRINEIQAIDRIVQIVSHTTSDALLFLVSPGSM
jgi:hypothetical protein